MLRKILHIVFLLHMVSFCFAQTSPSWIVSTEANIKTISINSDSILVDDVSASKDDYIGAFVENENGSFCVGFSKIDSSYTIINATFSPDSSILGGYSGNEIKFKHWNSENSCTYHSTQAIATFGSAILNNDSLFLDIINSYSLETPLSYDSIYINTGTIITPETNTIASEPVLYSVSSNTLDLDPFSGIIDLNLALDSTHEIQITSDKCLTVNNFSVEIIPEIDYSFLPWNITYGTEQHIIEINSDSIFTNDLLSSSNTDFIGAFAENNQGVFCIGISQLNEQTTYIYSSFSFDSSALSGHYGDEITFKHWSSSDSCVYHTTNTTSLDDSVILNGGSTFIKELYSFSSDASVKYDSVYENTGELITPETNIINSENIDFTLSSNTLLLDSLTGSIDLALATNDLHEVLISSETCLLTKKIGLMIVEKNFPIQPTDSGISPEPTIINEGNYISSQNSDFNTFEIESNGAIIEIYDRTGRLIISSSQTFQWDGTDQYGDLLPADDYYIKVGDTVTIVTVLH